jgi:hypothetical protein
MLSVNGTTNYSAARIDGIIFTDTTSDIEQLKFDTQAISYNDTTNTTNIDSSFAVVGTTQLGDDVNIAGDLSIEGEGVIKQEAVGIAANIMKRITLLPDHDLVFQGAGRISQGTTASSNQLNTIIMNSNSNISFSGSGIINQGGASGTNQMKNINLLPNQILSQSASGIISQVGSGTNLMKSITLNANNNLIQSGTGTINQFGSTSTNNTLTNTDVSGNLNVNASTTTNTLSVVGTADVSGNLNVTGITDTTRLEADNLILGTATYNAAVQLKMNGVMNMGDQVNLNTQSRVFNVRDTNGIVSIGRYSASEPGFELRNYNPVGGALRTDVLFLGGGAGEQIRCLFRSPGAGGDFVAWFGYRTLFDFQTPTQNNPAVQLTGTQQTARFRDKFTTPVGIIDIVLNPNAGNFSSIIQASDKTIVSQNAMPLALCCTNSIGGGIRLTSTGNQIGGNTTFTSGSNIIQSGSGIISQSGSGVNSMKAITLQGSDNFTQSGSGIISQSGSGVNAMKSITLNTNDTLTQSGSGIISQAGTGTNTLKQTLVTGTYPIEIIPQTPPSAVSTTANAILVIKNNPYSAGMVMETTAQGNILSYGINVQQLGSRTTAIKGGIFRFDTRPAEPLFSVITYPAGSNTANQAFRINDNGTAFFNGDITTQNIGMTTNKNLTQSGTGIISQTGTGTNALKATSITGVLGITGYANVRTTLDSLTASATATTGITYNAGTDTTTIDNNVKINKNLTLQDDTRLLTAPTGYVLDETEKHTWLYQINAGFSAPRTIRVTSFDSFNIDGDTNIGVYKFSFQLVKLIKGVTYTGAFFINSTVGTFGHTYQMALYDGGVGSVSFPLARLAVSDGFPNASGTLHYVPFRDAYVSPETKFAYVGIVCASTALNPVIRTTGIDYNRRYGITTCQTGSLTSLCCGFQGATNANFDTLGATFPPAQAMTAFTYQFWCGLYTE